MVAYYDDLTPYQYDYVGDEWDENEEELATLSPRRRRAYERDKALVLQKCELLRNAVNVGWLSGLHGYPTGETTADFHAALLQLCLTAPWGHRGYHGCELSPCNGRAGAVEVRVGRRRSSRLGSRVIIVLGRSRNYAAPNLIYHYVVEHGYHPPEEFIDAVLASDLPTKGWCRLLRNCWTKKSRS